MNCIVNKLLCSVLLLSMGFAAADAAPQYPAQDPLVTVVKNNISLKSVVSDIEQQTGFIFFYNNQLIDLNKKVDVRIERKKLSEALASLFKQGDILYKIMGKQIVLYPKGSSAEASMAGQTQEGPPTAGQTTPAASPRNGTDAQNEKYWISGTVVSDRDNSPLEFVTVSVKGTNSYALTDEKGAYRISAETPQSILVFHLMGYTPREESVNGRSVVNVALSEEASTLEEVMVTGYQTIRKDRSTGAYAVVGNQALEKQIALNPTAALEGQVAGVSTYGGGNNIVIRGASSFKLDANPLIVVDGMPTSRDLNDFNVNDIETLTVLKDAAATSIYGVRAANGVIVITTKQGVKGKMMINFSSDWEWSTNPTVEQEHLISTSDYIDFQLKALEYYGSKLSGTPKTPYQIVSVDWKPTIGTTVGQRYSPLLNLIVLRGSGQISDDEYNRTITDWKTRDYRKEYRDLVWRTPFAQTYNLSLSNRDERQNTYVSFKYANNLEQTMSNSRQYFAIYAKTDQKIAKWLSMNLAVDAGYSLSKSSTSYGENNVDLYGRILDDNGNRVQTPYPMSAKMSPDMIAQLGAYEAFDSYSFNVLDELERTSTRSNTISVRATLGLEFKIYKGLSFKPSFNYELNRTSQENIWNADSYQMRELRNRFISEKTKGSGEFVKNIPDGGRLSQSSSGRNNYTFRNQLAYNGTIKEIHSITATGGFEMREDETPTSSSALYFGYDPQTLSTYTLDIENLSRTNGRAGVINYLNNQAQSYSGLANPGLSYTLHRYVSIFAAAGYSFKNLYNLSGSFRIDQTDLFGTDPRYRYRPLWSVGAGWNVHNERFMAGVDWLDLLSVKASYGLTGNVDQSSSPYVLASYGVNQLFGDPIQYASLRDIAPNPTLRWERTTSYGLGVEFRLWKGLLNGSIEPYYKYSDDLLITKELPNAYGYNQATVNGGALSNRGVDITLSSTWFKKSGWTLSSKLIVNYNKDKIEKSYVTPRYASDLAGTPRMVEGNPVHSLYAYKYIGLKQDGTDAQNGFPMVVKRSDGSPLIWLEPDGTYKYAALTSVATDEIALMGSSVPLWSGSFTQSVRYKGFELNAMFTYYLGHVIRMPRFNFNPSITAPISQTVLRNDVTDAWSLENPNGSQPRMNIDYPKYVSSYTQVTTYMDNSEAYMEKGDILRLRRLSLSYQLPEKYAKYVYMKDLKITGQVNNLWKWTAVGDGYDPERESWPGTLPSYLLRLQMTF